MEGGVITYQLPMQVTDRLAGRVYTYTWVDMYWLGYLRSSYARYLYVLLCRVKDLRGITLSLGDLKQLMGVHNVKSYGLYSELKKRVILPAINEINDKTDIEVRLIETKQRRSKRVAQVSFRFKRKEDDPYATEEEKREARNRIARSKHIRKTMKRFRALRQVDPMYADMIQEEIARAEKEDRGFARLKPDIKIVAAMENLELVDPFKAPEQPRPGQHPPVETPSLSSGGGEDQDPAESLDVDEF